MKSIAKYCVLFVGILSAVSYFAHLHLEQIIALNPSHLVTFSEYWRLILYPFVEPSLTSFLFFAIAFLIFVPSLEKFFNKWMFYTILILLLPLTSCFETIIFWGKDINFYGTDVLTSFVFGLSIFIFPKNILKVIHLKSLNNYKAVVLIFAIWISIGIEKAFISDASNYFAYIFPILFGFIAAASIKLQMNFFFKYYFPRKKMRSFSEIKKIVDEVVHEKSREKSMDNIPNFNNSNTENREEENRLKLSDNLEENEETLNSILDKINNEGVASLTPGEKSFLEEFSKII